MPRLRRWIIQTALAATLIAPGLPEALGQSSGYRNHEALKQAVNDLAAEFEACTADVVGASRQSRGIFVLTLSADPATAAQRPALLITAGLDGRHWVGTETAMRVARTLLAEHAALLGEVTVYVIPRVNPDGTELNLGAVNVGHIGTMTVVDADRDGVADEDGPVDLNGDGMITQMRRPDPPLDDPATLMADPAAPRLLKKPDAMKGERAIYSLYIEGLDADGDGLIAEDGPGMVDLDRNFVHGWPEHAADSGTYQLSEPESFALATFVMEHPNIVAAITYGRHDTLVNPPDGKGKDITGRAPKNIDPGDVALYKEISKIYKEATGQTNAASADPEGSFHAWLYAHRGIPSFATTVWGRPGEAKERPASAPGNRGGAGGPPSAAGSWSGAIEIPEMGAMDFTLTVVQAADGSATATLSTSMFTVELSGTFDVNTGSLTLSGEVGQGAGASISGTVGGDEFSGTATGPDGASVPLKGRRSSAAAAAGGGEAAAKGDDDKPADAEGAAWLKYSDEKRGGAGFVPWTAFEHPTLGPVEIGGFAPGFQMNPPVEDLDDLAAKQTAFAVELLGRRPVLSVIGPEVTKLAPGLYDVRLAIANDGFLPTTTMMARTTRAIQPTVVKISTEVDRIVSGDRLSRSWGIDGSGGRDNLHWILRVDDGGEVTIEISNRQLGDRTITFTAR